ANLLGGDVLGEAEVTNWQNSIESPPARRQHPAGGRVAAESLQRGSVRLQLAGFPLLPVTEMLSSPKLPLDRLALAGSTSGNVELLWVGSIHDADVRLKLGIVPSQDPAPG